MTDKDHLHDLGGRSGDQLGEPARDIQQPAIQSPRKSRRWGIGAAIGLILTVAAAWGAVAYVRQAQETAAKINCRAKQLALAINNYVSEHGGLPPAVVYGENGEPLYSWRVLLLPYVEDQRMYEEFHLDEPWDSPHNIQLLERTPTLYEISYTRWLKAPPGHTISHLFTGPGTLFDDQQEWPPLWPLANADSTILLVEAGEPTPWSKPEDIVYDPSQPIELTGMFPDGYHAAFADGSVAFIEKSIDQAALHAMVTGGGEKPDGTW